MILSVHICSVVNIAHLMQMLDYNNILLIYLAPLEKPPTKFIQPI